ncbi:hypothetical protein [Frateuria sp. Soil773]|uniref:hypothetical protein n=1 Tax=Frateuria sp. Soil773 TaxID=1736407 RepID=UPI001910DC94|nr:hypothetical protein [Frateuria sp. Soil773]
MNSNPFDDDDFAPAAPAPVVAPPVSSAVDDDDWSTPAGTPVSAPAPAGLVSEEAKAAAKEATQKAKAIAHARAKQAGQAASVAAAGLKTRLAGLRGQTVGKTCKQVCACVAVVAVLACAGIEWRAHRSIIPPEVAAAPAPTLAPVEAAPVAPVKPVVEAPVVAAPVPAPPVAVPVPVAPAPVAQVQPVVKVPPVRTKAVDGPMNHLKPKTFNPMNPNYKPEKSKWESEQDQKLNDYFKKSQGH